MALRPLVRRALTLTTVATGAATVWALSHNPFAEVYVQRGLEDAQAVIARHMARTATPERLTFEVEQALAEDDMDRLLIALDTATDQGVILPRPLLERALQQAQAAESTGRRLSECAVCAWDIAQCRTITQITVCALPVEITPLGDVNALRRSAMAYGAGNEVDRIETGLALVGLAATGAVLFTAGGSAAIKAGATALRLARRSGRLSPEFAGVLARNSDIVTDARALPAYLAGNVPLDHVADTAKLARLGRIAEDMGTVARNTSPGEAIALLRHVDSAEDAARLARLSTAQGPKTRATLNMLGKTRAFRAMVRLSDLVLATLGLLAALLAQLFTLALALLRKAV
ncbi:hypothetical protein [Oceaniglobus ichthyenteri]|uniref:hypothetical protein n=1 Tax=Oceaniglobus ichthyenteri TaxID=2136177 RepID=UPI000D3CFECB|nr:hypothetical protein [Oceaniglobus ichthyenteri]